MVGHLASLACPRAISNRAFDSLLAQPDARFFDVKNAETQLQTGFHDHASETDALLVYIVHADTYLASWSSLIGR